MSARMYGADADELERLADQFRKSAADLDGEGRHLTGVLNRLSWLGDVATDFLGDWAGVSLPKIGLSTEFLRRAAANLDRQAKEQRTASTSVGSGGGSRPPATLSSKKQHEDPFGQAGEMAGKTPAEQAAWWNSLTPDEKDLILKQRPGWLTGMPGLPAGVRKAATDQLMADVASDVVIATDGYEAGGSGKYMGWDIGGALTGQRIEYADGSVDLTVTGELTAGISAGDDGVAGGGLATATFHFDTQKEADAFLRGLRRSFLSWSGGPLRYLAGHTDNLQSGGSGLVGHASVGTGMVAADVDASVVVELNRDKSVTLTAAGMFTGAVLPPTSLTLAALGEMVAPGFGGVSIGDQTVVAVEGQASLNLGLDGSAQSLTLSYDVMNGTSSGLHGAQEVAEVSGTGSRTILDFDLQDPALADAKDQLVSAVKRGDVESVISQLDEVSERDALIDRATVTHSTYTTDGHTAELGVEVASVGGGDEHTKTTSVTVKPPGGKPQEYWKADG